MQLQLEQLCRLAVFSASPASSVGCPFDIFVVHLLAHVGFDIEVYSDNWQG